MNKTDPVYPVLDYQSSKVERALWYLFSINHSLSSSRRRLATVSLIGDYSGEMPFKALASDAMFS